MAIDSLVARTILGLWLAFNLGCQTTKVISRPVAASDLQTRGIVCGSFPNRQGEAGLTVCNVDTGEVHLVSSRSPQSNLFSKKPEDSEPDPFLLALPPGRYEFCGARTRKADWCEFEAPFELAAGQIVYVGEMRLDVKKRIQSPTDPVHMRGAFGGVMSTVELVNVSYSNLTRDKNKPQVASVDAMARDIQILRGRHPEIAWQQAENRISILSDLEVRTPFVSKKARENYQRRTEQQKADKAAGVQRSTKPSEVILQR